MRLGEQRSSRMFSQTTSRSMMSVQPLAFGALSFLGREAIGIERGIVDELGEQDCAGGGERPARPPQVQRGRDGRGGSISPAPTLG